MIMNNNDKTETPQERIDTNPKSPWYKETEYEEQEVKRENDRLFEKNRERFSKRV